MLFIYCAGAFSLEVADIALATGICRDDIRFIDDNKSSSSDTLRFADYLNLRTKDDNVIIAHGEPVVRFKIYSQLESVDSQFATLVHPSSIISPSSRIQPGSIVCPLCSISSRSTLGVNTVVNTMSIVGHDVSISQHSVLSSMVNMGGSVMVEDQVYIGMGALIRGGLTLRSHSIVSMGSVVHRDVECRVIVQGDPARPRLINQHGKIFKH